MQPISRTRIACTLLLCTISSVVFTAATLAPQQIKPLDSTVGLAPTAALKEAATQDPRPSIAQQPIRSTLSSPRPPAAYRVRTPTPQFAVVSQQPREQSTEDRLNVPLLSLRVPTQQPGGGGTLAVRAFRLRTLNWQTGIWWPNPAQLAGLGLTDEQKARIDKTLESYNQNIASNAEQLEKEETQFAQLLEADPIDRGALLTQLDRVIQARGEMERTNAAMTLEMREYLTHAQWMQLPRPSLALNYFNKWLKGTPNLTIQVPAGGPGARGGARGGRGQQ